MIGAPVYPDVLIYMDQDEDGIPETDITRLVCSSITGQHGNFNTDDSDRTASAGKITLEIENMSRSYTGVDFIGRGIAILLRHASRTKQVYYGVVQAPTEDDSGPVLPLHIKLTAPDWIKTANNARLTGLEVTTFKRSNEALDALMDVQVNPPARRDFEVGTEVFANMFDGAGPKSKVFAEVDRVTKSELAQTYLRFREDGTGEILVHENKYHRGAGHPLSRIPVQVADPPLLMYHGNAGASGLLMYHGNAGRSGNIKLARAQEASLDRRHYHADWNAGAILSNDFTVTNVFRTTDIADVVLYEIQYPIKIGSTQIEEINGPYTNPGSGQLIQAFNVSIQAADIVFNSQADGLGTDLSANLQNAGFSFQGSRFWKRLRNTGPAGYLISFKVKGKGIYKHSPNDVVIENVESQQRLRAVYPDNLTRDYSNDLYTSRVFGTGNIALRRLPNMDLTQVSYKGNTDELALMAFMYLEQGDKVHIIDDHPVHAGDYYIQGVKFKIDLGGGLDYTWFLREDPKTLCTPIAAEASVTASRIALDYGILPRLANMQAFSYSIWVKRQTSSAFGVLIARSVDTGSGRRGNYLHLSNRTLTFISHKTPTDGTWQAANAIPNDTNWHLVTLTYENNSDKADPVISVDGASVMVTETATPEGQSDDDSDCPLMLFNLGPDPLDVGTEYYYDVVQDFVIKDPRVYGPARILTAAEIAELAAGEDDYSTVPENKLFNGIFVPTSNLADYVGDTLEEDDLTLEIVQGAAGTPYAENTASSATMITGTTI